MDVGLVVFGAQSKSPSPEYLDSVRSFILSHRVLNCIAEEVHTFEETRQFLAAADSRIAGLAQGPGYTSSLTDWIANGNSEGVATIFSGIVSLPRLAIIQLAQYFHFLDGTGLSHAEFIAKLKNLGGLQGFCGGLPAAIALASASDEAELKQRICTALRLAYAIGLYAELGDDSGTPGTTTMVVRLKHSGQAEQLIADLKGVYISAVTDPRSVSIVGPAEQLTRLQENCKNQGLLTSSMDIRGKTHNPENNELADELVKLCIQSHLLDMGSSDRLQISLRSNTLGVAPIQGSLTEVIVRTILAERCEWFDLLSAAAADIKQANVSATTIACFGIGDCTPLFQFHQLGIRATKVQHTSVGADHSVPAMPFGALPTPSGKYVDDAIAIIGAACRFPGANNLEELWNVISNKQDMSKEVPSDRFDLRGSYRGAQSKEFMQKLKFHGNFIEGIDSFDNAFFGINPREATSMDPQQRMLLQLAYEAMESCGYVHSHDRSRGDDVGCFIGASFVEYLDNTNSHAPTAYTSTGTIRAFLCGRVAHHFGWTGPAEVIDTACSSSLVAINRAVKAVRTGECSMALAGGVNAITGIGNYMDLAKAGFLSPTGQCKPFDNEADGYCRSEGGGVIVLKPLENAQLDGDHIMAVIPGAATNQGGLSCALTIPDSDALSTLYRSVLKQAHLSPELVTYVEAHGTGTQAGDPVEVASIRKIFGHPQRSYELTIGSIKGNIGHCETAAGVAGLLKVICMLNQKSIPAQANHKTWNTKIPSLPLDKLAISDHLKAWDVPFRAALVNSYGAAGSNAALLCVEAPAMSQQRIQRKQSYPLFISAKSETSVRAYQHSLARYLASVEPQPHISQIAFVLGQHRRLYRYSLILDSASTSELTQKLADSHAALCSKPVSKDPEKVVLLFGGQSRRSIGLAMQIYDRYPVFRSKLDICDSALREMGYPSILPAVFSRRDIEDIVVLQTGLVAIEYVMATCWLESGLQVHAIVGHSLGELAALAVSGILSIRDCLKLVAARASLMKELWGPETGSMLAVSTTSDTIINIITALDLPIDIACFNAKESLVLAGDAESIGKIEAYLSSLSSPIKCTPVDTSHAFHSRLVSQSILSELDRVAMSLEWHEPMLPIRVCSELGVLSLNGYPYNPSIHARSPVYFGATLTAIEKDLGKSIWLEVGVNSPIVPMAKRALSQDIEHSFHALTTAGKLDRADADPIVQIVRNLWQDGISVGHWAFLHKSSAQLAVWLPPYQFDKKPAWLDNVDHAAALTRELKLQAATHLDPVNSPRTTQPLVALHPKDDDKEVRRRFVVNSGGERFRTIISGHAVRDRPLCPASVYMECVANAVQIITTESSLRLQFENIDLQAPLGVASEGVEVELHFVASKSWAFSVTSSARNTGKPLVHGRGVVTLRENCQGFQTAASRLVQKRMHELEHTEMTEKLRSQRAYGMFSRVVSYQPFLRGIASIAMHESEAAATIAMPGGQPAQDESAPQVIAVCEAVTMDNFIQTVGLLINTSELVSAAEVMVCTGIDSSTTTAVCDMANQKSWSVYASFSPISSSQATGDVFAFVDGSLAATFTGCRFTKLDMARLEKALDAVNPVSQLSPQDFSPSRIPKASAVPKLTIDQSITLESESDPGTPTTFDHDILLEVLQRYTGAEPSRILDGMSLGDIGVDSLAAIELAGELSVVCQIVVDGEDLVSMRIGELRKRLPSGAVQSRSSQTGSVRNAPNTRSPTADLESSSTTPRNGSAEVMRILSETTGLAPSVIDSTMSLEDIGIDSLALVEIVSEMSAIASTPIEPVDLSLQNTVSDLLRLVSPNAMTAHQSPTATIKTADILKPAALPVMNSNAIRPDAGNIRPERSHVKLNIEAALTTCEDLLERAARESGFVNYWSEVNPKQDQLVLAYVREAYLKLGIDMATFKPGDVVPEIPHQPHHSRLVGRLCTILAQQGLIRSEEGRHVACAHAVPMSANSAELYREFISQYPRYAIEAQLMELTGPRLAECLTGIADPIKLLFGDEAASAVIGEYYARSPMLSTLTTQLVHFIATSLKDVASTTTTVNILEVGAGTGGTTAALLDRLAASGVRIQYTFSDIASSIISKAKRRFAKYDWVTFMRLDLEGPVPDGLKSKFDIILGTNCVHATSDRVANCSKLRQMLSPTGCLVLSEVTRVINWYDIVFGLLKGWWLDDMYPLQSPNHWMNVLRQAGFPYTTFTTGPSEDLNTQQLLIGSNDRGVAPAASAPRSISASPLLQKETTVYKTVAGVQILADIYFPSSAPRKPMPIALLIHGGGHMTLSRQAVRPWQIAHLLSRGILPISVDYRLAPEINIIEGAMADICDAVIWCRASSLSSIVAARGIAVDPASLVTIGWSSGGHLAMSTAWTVAAAGGTPPVAVLSFYAPTDFLSPDLFPQRKARFFAAAGKLSEEQLREVPLLATPITGYHVQGGEEPDLGWVKEGDGRSELLLSLFRRGADSGDFGLSLMLNGRLGQQQRTVGELTQMPPSLERRVAICPTAQLKAGNYKVPTFILHGDADEIAPFSCAMAFHAEMTRQGLRSGFLAVPKARHIHDLRLDPESAKWALEVEPGYAFLFDILGV